MKAITYIKVLPLIGVALQAIKVTATDLGNGAFGIEVFVPTKQKFNYVRKFLEAFGFDFMDEVDTGAERMDYYGLQTDDQRLFELACVLDD